MISLGRSHLPKILALTVAFAGTVLALPAHAGLPPGGMSASAVATAFSTYGNTSGRWSGADATASVPLPDGRVAWLFADTFLGPVNADFTRPRDRTAFVNNTIVIQDGTSLVDTRHGGTTALPEALVKPSQAGEFLWVQDGTVENGTLKILYNRYRKTGSGMWDFAQTGTTLATLSLPALTVQSVVDLPLGSAVAWGSSIVEDGTYTYVYGTEAGPDNLKYAKLARVPAGGLGGAWQFWTGTSWSATESAATRLFSGVGTSFGVQKVGSQYVYVTQESGLIFHPGFFAYTATSPTGPFTGPTHLFTAPEPQPGNNQFAYDSRVHPELARPGKLLISYNVNSFEGDDHYADARIYRPRFVEIDWPRPAPDPGRPAAPTGLTASLDVATASIRLQWTAPAGTGLKYWVYQRDVTAGQTHFTRVASSVPQTSTNVGMVKSGHRYELKIAAENALGEGPASSVVSFTPTIAPPPAPGAVTATAGTDGTVTLAWSTVPNAWNYIAYQRDVTAGATTFTRVNSANALATSMRIESLVQDHRYEFYLLAEHGGGLSPQSAKVQATAHADAPGAPTGMTATANADGTIRLSWTAPTSGGSGLYYWVYQRDTTAGEATFIRLSLPIVTGTSMTAGYLAHQHRYEYKVTAENRGGESAASNVASATATYPLPARPTGLTATAGNAEVVLSWTATAPDDWYWVYLRDVTAGETAFTKLAYPVAGGTTARPGYLTNGHEYEFKVSAIGRGGEGPASATVRATPRAPLPAQVTGLTATPNPDCTVTLSWTAQTAVYFWVYMRDVTAGETAFTKLALPIEGNTLAAGYLTHNHVYEFKVAGTNAAGDGPASTTVQATARHQAPPAPTNLRGVSSGDGGVDLHWDSSRTGLMYWIYQRNVTAGETAFTKSTLPADKTTARVGMLRDGNVYEFRVTSANPAGESAASNTIRVTATGGVPAPPSNLVAVAGDGQVNLSWTASPTAGVYYTVYYRDATAGQSWQSLPYPVTTCCTAVAGYLLNGQTYEFRVTAINPSGDSTPTNVATARPMPPLPAAPTGLTATAGNGQITMRWTASTSANVWYWIEYRTGGGAWQRSAYPLSTCCTFTLAYLNNGTWYDVRVRATNLSGDSAPSNVASARPLPPLPAAPASVTVAATGNPELAVSWSASATPNVYYWVEFRLAGAANWTRVAYPVVNCCAFRAGYLEPGRRYEFRVIATNAAGDGPPSPVASEVVYITPPQAPTGLTVVPRTTMSGVSMYWTVVPDGPLKPTAYTVQAKFCGDSAWFTIGFMVTSSAYSYDYSGCHDFRVIGDRYGTPGPPSNVDRAFVPRNDYRFQDGNHWLFDGWGFMMRECTSFAAWRIKMTWVYEFSGGWRLPPWDAWANASHWDSAARNAGVRVDTTPVVGSVIQHDGGAWGHVAWVIAIDGGTVYVEQYNADGNHNYSVEGISNLSGYEFIHFEEW